MVKNFLRGEILCFVVSG